MGKKAKTAKTAKTKGPEVPQPASAPTQADTSPENAAPDEITAAVMEAEAASRMGRPEKPIDMKSLDGLLALQCTQLEVAGFFEVSVDTLERRIKKQFGMTYAEYSDLKRAPGKIALRRKQYQMALAGSARMLQWLGQNWLGQSSRQEHTGPEGGPIETKSTIDLTGLTKSELLLLRKVMQKKKEE